MTVYIITCHANQKYYIGQTVEKNLGTYLRRKYGHALAHTEKLNHIYSALRKYPIETFTIEPLSNYGTKSDMDMGEMIWIAALNSRNDSIGMNITRGGEGGWSGMKHSPESLVKMRGRHRTPSEEERKKHSIRMTGRGNPNYGKKGRITWMKKLIASRKSGLKHTEETKARMSAAAIELWNQRRGGPKINKPPYQPKGYTFRKECGKYEAYIQHGEYKSLGLFNSPEEAHAIYLEAKCARS
jgi:group I intron endonuclease